MAFTAHTACVCHFVPAIKSTLICIGENFLSYEWRAVSMAGERGRNDASWSAEGSSSE